MTDWLADTHAHVQRLVSVVKMAKAFPKGSVLFCDLLWARRLNATDIPKEIQRLIAIR
jgi:hypothetical protein